MDRKLYTGLFTAPLVVCGKTFYINFHNLGRICGAFEVRQHSVAFLEDMDQYELVVTEIAILKDSVWRLTGRVMSLENFIQNKFGEALENPSVGLGLKIGTLTAGADKSNKNESGHRKLGTTAVGGTNMGMVTTSTRKLSQNESSQCTTPAKRKGRLISKFSDVNLRAVEIVGTRRSQRHIAKESVITYSEEPNQMDTGHGESEEPFLDLQPKIEVDATCDFSDDGNDANCNFSETEENDSTDSENDNRDDPDFIPLNDVEDHSQDDTKRGQMTRVKSHEEALLSNPKFQGMMLPNPELSLSNKPRSPLKGCQKKRVNYVCRYCKKQFRERAKYVEHELTHGESKNFPCRICGKAFVNQGNRRGHERRHNRENYLRYPCNQCERTFMTQTELKSHSFTHLPSNRFTCTYCGRGYKCLQAFNAHEAEHKKEKEIVCPNPTCGKVFYTLHFMKRHFRAVHKGSKMPAHLERRSFLATDTQDTIISSADSTEVSSEDKK